jgi:carboxyl-terminal processing protease
MMDDGRSTRIPDSLTTVFHTQSGREVRDGGGIRPDIEPKPEEVSTLLFYLLQDMALFDFATDFRINNDSIAPASEFSIDDTTYAQFCEYLKNKNFSYDLRSVKMLGDLKKMIDFEGLGNVVKEELKALEEKLNADLEQSLQHFKEDIKDLLADEIVTRYYGRQGEIVYNLKKDKEITEACSILDDKEKYTQLLMPADKK